MLDAALSAASRLQVSHPAGGPSAPPAGPALAQAARAGRMAAMRRKASKAAGGVLFKLYQQAMPSVGSGLSRRRGGWLHTYSGHQFWPMDPHAEDVLLVDIAHHLGMKARFSGACVEMLTVAQHSVELSHLVPGGPLVEYAALHHDDTEAYLPDIPTPVKPHVPFWRTIEGLHEQAIVIEAFHVDRAALRKVKPYDKRIVSDEAACLMLPSIHKWKVRPEPLGVVITPWTPEEATQRYLERHAELANQLGLPPLAAESVHGRIPANP